MNMSNPAEEMTDKASECLRNRAKNWASYCREYVATKRVLCKQVVSILNNHPKYPNPTPKRIAMSASRMKAFDETVLETARQFDDLSMNSPYTNMDVPEVPAESPTSSCCSSPNPCPLPETVEEEEPIAPVEDPEEQGSPSNLKGFLKKEYTRICESLKRKYEEYFPSKEDMINSMILDIEELIYCLRVLEVQYGKLKGFYENEQALSNILKRRTNGVILALASAQRQFEKTIDCKWECHEKMKEYVHDKLAASEKAGEPSPFARCSRENKQASGSATPERRSSRETQSSASATPERRYSREAKSSASATPERRYSREAKSSASATPERRYSREAKSSASATPERRYSRETQASTSAPGDQDHISSKRTPKHSAKDPREKKKLKMSETQSICIESRPGDMVMADQNKEVDLDSSDSTCDTVSTNVCDSVEGILLTESEDDYEKKPLSESPKKTETKSKASLKKELPETKVAKTGSPFKSIHDPKKTGTKPKKASGKKDLAETKVAKTRSPFKIKHEPKTTYEKKPFSLSRYGRGYEEMVDSDSD